MLVIGIAFMIPVVLVICMVINEVTARATTYRQRGWCRRGGVLSLAS